MGKTFKKADLVARILNLGDSRQVDVVKAANTMFFPGETPSVAEGKNGGHTTGASPKPKTKRKKQPRTYTHDFIVRLLAPANPKRGKSRERFDHYRDKMTVRAALATPITADDLKWDSDGLRNFILLVATDSTEATEDIAKLREQYPPKMPKEKQAKAKAA
jgi:hypothetical protein